MSVLDFICKMVTLLNATIKLAEKVHTFLKKHIKKGPSDDATSDRPVEDCTGNQQTTKAQNPKGTAPFPVFIITYT